MSVSEYCDRFIRLSRYALDEVAEDERKQEHIIKGLNGPLQYALMAHSFPSFQRLLDKALDIEHKHVQLGDMKRKAITQGQESSSVCPCYVPPQGTPALTGGGQRPAQFTPQRTPPTHQATPTGTRRSSQDKVQAPHATSVVILGIMLMFVQRGLLVPHSEQAADSGVWQGIQYYQG
jgi:hypothetical protein